MTRKIAIFGGGITGLAAGRELARRGHEVDVYEASDHVGGLASTFRSDDGFTYDNGPRFIFSTLAEKIGIADQCEPVQYYEDLYVGGRYYLFPFGFIRNPKYCLSAGIATLTRSFHRRPQTLGDFLRVYYGRTFSGEVLRPLIEKWSGVDATKMSVDFASRLLPTNVAYILYSVLKKLRGGVTEDYYKKGRYIVYPRKSNAIIFEKLMAQPGLRVHLNSPLEGLASEGSRVVGARVKGKAIQADAYISTIPIDELAQFSDQAEAMNDWQKFHYRGISILFLKLSRPKLLSHLWTWFPEAEYPFYRISEYKNALPQLAPADKTLISIEIASDLNSELWKMDQAQLTETLLPYLQKLYGLDRREIIGGDLRRSKSAYPVLERSYEEAQRALTHRTPFENLFIAGRTGMFQYRMTEGSYDSAISCVEALLTFLEGGHVSDLARPKIDRFGRPQVVHE